MMAAGWFEIAYIVFRAARAEASHFNTATPTAALFYSLMGLGAVMLTAVAFTVGARLWMHRRNSLVTEAASIGLMLGAVLGTAAGIYLGGQPGHTVGGDLTDASGGFFFGWSTTGGDLRIAHFVGLHAMQIIPLAALSGKRSAVYATAIVITLATVAVFAQALMGQPLLGQ